MEHIYIVVLELLLKHAITNVDILSACKLIWRMCYFTRYSHIQQLQNDIRIFWQPSEC